MEILSQFGALHELRNISNFSIINSRMNYAIWLSEGKKQEFCEFFAKIPTLIGF